ncbi:hypothetical protein CC77DRAFT_1025855 [Alternaria alternata]|uniref:Uncharacterized protein n=1 Tax=Alternaria alternata TaxID=5599 RepID=A0A177D5L4_ALTAL|nr:hypothetical protein CC77DRAFT_1025855 [Alternaria alternata]OAG14450.1 hypothetical protein CC77DRAFT_1025855 [Alternaria alternata]
MMSHPHVLLSTVFLVSNWLDMLAGLPGDSTRTGFVRAEIMGMCTCWPERYGGATKAYCGFTYPASQN